LAYDGQRADTEQSAPGTRLTDLGLVGFDYVLGGGLPESSVYLLTGGPGTHYVTFANQAVYNHLSKGGKAVIYNPETPLADTIEDMALYHWNIRPYLDDRALVYSRPMPPQLQSLSEALQEDPMEEVIRLGSSLAGLTKDFVEKLKEGRWSVFNPSYLMSVYPQQEVTDLVMFWVGAVHRYGGVHFLTLPEGVHDERHLNFIKSLVDGAMSFKFAQGFGQAEGEVEIQKLRRVIPKSKTFRHTVQSDGIAIETTARIG
jgi:KaiC/GvpD/RAD55 family RecA-like ATPase